MFLPQITLCGAIYRIGGVYIDYDLYVTMSLNVTHIITLT